MDKGIIYLMSTIVKGLVKIGETTDFEQRMQKLENNGYQNVTGLKREFAIRVDGYVEKENLLHTIFAKSRVGDTELFSLDINLVKQLLSALDGEIIYPPAESKEEVFEEATEAVLVPAGTYYCKGKKKKYDATVEYKEGKIILLAKSQLAPIVPSANKKSKWFRDRNALAYDEEKRVLLENYECSSFSNAASIVTGGERDGWTSWKNDKDEFIDVYRPKKETEAE